MQTILTFNRELDTLYEALYIVLIFSNDFLLEFQFNIIYIDVFVT